MGVSYDRDQRARAKREKIHLVTLDITGQYAPGRGATYRGFLLTPEEVKKAWEFFDWLIGLETEPEAS